MSSYIREIQTILKQKGFYKGEVDGIAGNLTVSAVEKALQSPSHVLTEQDCKAVMDLNKSDPNIVEPTIPPMPDKTENSGFVFSEQSLKKIASVKEPLQRVVKLALQCSHQDFTVLAGLRSKERQAQLLKQGATQTMQSNHLTGNAIDLAPIVDGKVSWDFNLYYEIARAMKQAANELGISIRWGGGWDFSKLKGNPDTPQQMVKKYTDFKKARKEKAFMDGPHFEIYPPM